MLKVITPLLIIFSLGKLGADESQEPGKQSIEAVSTRSGFTVTVEFLVNAEGEVLKTEVIATEKEALNDFALAMAKQGRFPAKLRPASGSKPQLVRMPYFFPVENYPGNEPLPLGMSKPICKKNRPITYPFELLRAKKTGGVWAAFTVGADGSVKKCRVVKSSHKQFAEVTQEGLLKWKFNPAQRGGKAVEATVNMAISFDIAGQPLEWQWRVAPEPCIDAYNITGESIR